VLRRRGSSKQKGVGGLGVRSGRSVEWREPRRWMDGVGAWGWMGERGERRKRGRRGPCF
jgi:hypothetical protein